jgi:N-acetylneuraminate synthase/N,N'-diacetyllegionaminate synthase
MTSIKIIPDISSNWKGDLNLAKTIIKECKHLGVDAVKFQLWKAKKLYPKNDIIWELYPNLEDFELTYEKAIELKNYSDKIGIEWFTSVFHPDDVKFLEEIGVKRYKVSCGQSNNMPLLKKISKTQKPVIISVPKVPDSTWLNNYDFLFRNNYKLLYCVSNYPTEPSDIDFDFLNRFKIHFFNGFSNHCTDLIVPSTACAIACYNSLPEFILETHIMLHPEKYTPTPDACCSYHMDVFAILVRDIRSIEGMFK